MIERGPFLIPEWDAPGNVEAWFTTRKGGVSTGPHASLNLGLHVGDRPEAVRENRRLALLGVDRPAVWLQQDHGTTVVELTADSASRAAPAADAAVTASSEVVCAVLVADCLAVLLCDRDGRRVGVAHAGWRGLCAGILESSVAAMAVAPHQIVAFLCPAIGPRAFEVGPEVHEAFVAASPASAAAFAPVAARPGKYLADLPALARIRLRGCGVVDIGGGALCTASNPELFFSYRRDGVTGRMGAFIRLVPAAR
ncbi:MAG TPA: peptidoglycan editing factor PgeF [Usitatibacteraceae bacterium]|nr:peptidoglycan editing factor PgeF [Usitatibacteraceae bacterium]